MESAGAMEGQELLVDKQPRGTQTRQRRMTHSLRSCFNARSSACLAMGCLMKCFARMMLDLSVLLEVISMDRTEPRQIARYLCLMENVEKT